MTPLSILLIWLSSESAFQANSSWDSPRILRNSRKRFPKAFNPVSCQVYFTQRDSDDTEKNI